MRRILFLLIFGLTGLGILLSLGTWQMQRLTWKQAIIAQIETRIGAPPVALPLSPDPVRDKYLPVRASGVASPGLRVLASVKRRGPGYRMISVLETDGRRVLLDRGFLRIEDHTDFYRDNQIEVTGNLHWPDEVDGFTPDPDLEKRLWFARDVPAMSRALGTEPVLIVARVIDPDTYTARPLPVGVAGIANNHLQYAITWFSLALIWVAMSLYYLWRTRASAKGPRP